MHKSCHAKLIYFFYQINEIFTERNNIGDTILYYHNIFVLLLCNKFVKNVKNGEKTVRSVH